MGVFTNERWRKAQNFINDQEQEEEQEQILNEDDLDEQDPEPIELDVVCDVGEELEWSGEHFIKLWLEDGIYTTVDDLIEKIFRKDEIIEIINVNRVMNSAVRFHFMLVREYYENNERKGAFLYESNKPELNLLLRSKKIWEIDEELGVGEYLFFIYSREWY